MEFGVAYYKILKNGLLLATKEKFWMSSENKSFFTNWNGQTTTIITTTTTTTGLNIYVTNLTYSAVTGNNWVHFTHSYIPAKSSGLSLTFLFSNTQDSTWYLDDVSLIDSSSNQKITNGGFESSTASWWDGSNGPCNNTGMQYGSTTTRSHSGNKSYRDRCTPSEVWVAQAFNATAGMTYILSFWISLNYTYTGTTSDIWLSVAMN
ncbi:unnamed protein product [Rotaria magnacalcarata]|uniref:Uncharacterized protein n=1 Tax=Rotaria magnacalcarata TaxID=392030 RepID=A0A8S2UGH1_9BILA|nr:unnamed protein product [Rotaria magnacalcarata]CAF4785555.1 unnamed protein product [Rotaria magnacalcarata]